MSKRNVVKKEVKPPTRAVKGDEAVKANRFVRELMMLPPIDHSDVKQLEERFLLFLDLCEKYEVQVTNQTAYSSLGVGKDQVSLWVNRERGTKEIQDFFIMVKQVCAANRELLTSTGTLPPVTSIWWQKNHDGYTDEVVHKVQAEPKELVDADAIRRKYIEESTPIDVEVIENGVGGVQK